MSTPETLQATFRFQDTTYDVVLTKGKASDHSVKIGNEDYVVSILGNEEKLQSVCKILAAVNLDAVSSSEDLQQRLSLLPPRISMRTGQVGMEVLLHEGEETATIVRELTEHITPTIPVGAAASVLVAANGEKPQHIGFGSTSVDHGDPINPDTAAVIGSGAKMFTGVLSKVLEQKNILSLKTTLADVLEERHFAIFADPEAAKKITLEMLLTHTSGLQFDAEIGNNERENMRWDEILEGMLEATQANPTEKIKFTGVPGDGVFSYSNQICLAGAMIEHFYNQAYAQENPSSDKEFTYAEILEREVLAPLGMTRTSFVKPEENVIRAYKNDHGTPASLDADLRDPVMHPVGGLWSTATDMGKFAEALATAFKDGKGLRSADGEKVLLSSENLTDLLTTRGISGEIALGIDIVDSFFGKGGEISSYDFKFNFDRDTGSYIVSFCNFKDNKEFGDYIRCIIPTMDEMHHKFSGKDQLAIASNAPRNINVSETHHSLTDCDEYYMGAQGIIGKNRYDDQWVSWNGETLPLTKQGKDRFLIGGTGPYSGKTLILGVGQASKDRYIFIEEVPETEKCVVSTAFKEVKVEEKEKHQEIEQLKNQKNILLRGIKDAEGVYFSARVDGADPMRISIDPEHGIKVLEQRQRDPREVTVTISDSKKDQNGKITDLWLVGNIMIVPMYELKLSKNADHEWQLEIIDFASKKWVETLKRR